MEVVREVEVRDEVRDTACTCGGGGGGGCKGAGRGSVGQVGFAVAGFDPGESCTAPCGTCRSSPKASPHSKQSLKSADENQGNSGRIRMVRGMDEHSGTTAPHFSQIDRLGQTVILSLEPLRAGGLRAHSFRKTDSRMLRTDARSKEQS